MFARWLSVVAGLWLVIAPWVLPHAPAQAATNDFWTGLSIIGVSLVASRVSTLRFINTGLGGWLLAAPFMLSYGTYASTINDVIVGVAVIGLSLVPNFRRVDVEVHHRQRVVTP